MATSDFPEFTPWLWLQRKRFAARWTFTIAMLQALLPLLKPYVTAGGGLSHLLPPLPIIAALPAIAHVLVLVTLVFLVERIPAQPQALQVRYPRANEAVKQFLDKWRMLWITWLFLYSFLTLKALLLWIAPTVVAQQAYLTAWSAGTTLLNNLQTLYLVLCFFILSEWTLRERPSSSTESTASYERHIPIRNPAIAVITLLTIGHLVWGLLQSSANLAFELVSGVIASAALSLFVGRLESKILNPPKWIIIALYVYAGIQPLYIFLSYNDEFPGTRAMIIIAVLPLKLLLFAFVYWFLTTPLAIYYCDRAEHLKKNAHSDWNSFLRESERPFKASQRR